MRSSLKGFFGFLICKSYPLGQSKCEFAVAHSYKWSMTTSIIISFFTFPCE